MITKEDIKLIEATMYIDRNRDYTLKEKDLPIQERWRKVLFFKGLVLDIETGNVIKPLPSPTSQNAKLFTLYYKNIYELQYVTNDDLLNGLTIFNNYLNSIETKPIINIVDYKAKKRTLK